jgi:hypothetical protein
MHKYVNYTLRDVIQVQKLIGQSWPRWLLSLSGKACPVPGALEENLLTFTETADLCVAFPLSSDHSVIAYQLARSNE